jgi:hypothetical protein
VQQAYCFNFAQLHLKVGERLRQKWTATSVVHRLAWTLHTPSPRSKPWITAYTSDCANAAKKSFKILLVFYDQEFEFDEKEMSSPLTFIIYAHCSNVITFV